MIKNLVIVAIAIVGTLGLTWMVQPKQTKSPIAFSNIQTVKSTTFPEDKIRVARGGWFVEMVTAPVVAGKHGPSHGGWFVEMVTSPTDSKAAMEAAVKSL